MTVSVTPLNDAPLPTADRKFAAHGQPLTVRAADLAANDQDPDGDPLRLAAVSGRSARGGSVRLFRDTVTYTPAPGFSGRDLFTYVVSDGRKSGTGRVLVEVRPEERVASIREVSPPGVGPATPAARRSTGRSTRRVSRMAAAGRDTFRVEVVKAARSANRPPTAIDDVEVTRQGRPVTIRVLANDNDPDGRLDANSVRIITPPRTGQATVNRTTGTITYEPPPGFASITRFDYEVRDTEGAAARATVFVSVRRGPLLTR